MNGKDLNIEPTMQSHLEGIEESNNIMPEKISHKSIGDIPIVFAGSILDTSTAGIKLTLDDSLITNLAMHKNKENTNITENVANQKPCIKILQN